ncbi:MAG: phosphoribosylglycinamide formyltransferase [Deltaproteobacteria bacterium]|nr:phosphoribosylglycinamide formyltransferase [Deltaproteobacteria bacterium]
MALRIVVLLSGSGTTLENLIEWRAKGQLDIEIVAVVSSKPSAFGLERARRHGLATHAVDRRAYRDERGFNNALHRILDEYQPELLVLAGFLTRLELRGYSGRTMNVHPALVPAFSGKGYYGERVFRAVLESAVKLTGVTVHFCDDEYDTGPIILQEAVPVEDDDSVDSLARRVQEKERDLYPRAIQLYAEGRLQLQGRRVRILPRGSRPRP